ncbi:MULTISPECIES: reverse transcriptase family protein [Variovorax]|jgi:hypothetical protein|uniref:reverse transcriptase family protein n=1 Tax=Variovorax TaxID=34072 RepID=UPI001AD5FC76|nr:MULTISPECIES: reverse transcriptase family protein [Variovorax]MBN8757423.1 RNA-directed DNA polymerase [Variovorax sp.]UKI08518.1 reverse transcriptase family protein [Variovorax paradoxus]
MSTAKGYQLDQSPLYKLESKRKLAKLLFWDLSRLQALANRTDNYRSKKTMHANKERSLEVPKPALENVQRRIYQLLDRIEKPDYLHSGRKQRSYITNAQVHAGAVWLIKLDIKKFYAAVSSARVYRFFQDVMRCSPDVASLLAKLCTARGHLAIGSRVSQLLAFFSAKPMFDELHARALEYSIKDTYYVDDLTWSGTRATAGFLWEVKKIVHRHGFEYHRARLYAPNNPKLVTGVQIIGDRIAVPPYRDRELWDAIRTLKKPSACTTLKVAETLLSKAAAYAQVEDRFQLQVRQLRALRASMKLTASTDHIDGPQGV